MAGGVRSTLGSIRFRLTAWYTLLLVGVLVAIGLPLASLFEHQLAVNRDRRLESTAREIVADFEPLVPGWFAPAAGGFESGPTELLAPNLDDYILPGLYIQVNNGRNDPIARSSNLGSVVLPSTDWPPGTDEVTLDQIAVGSVPLRTVRVPIYHEGLFYGALIVGESLAPFEETLAELRRLFIVASGTGVVLAAVGGWLIAGRALRPIDRMTAAAAGIAGAKQAAPSLRTRLDVPPTGDEVARLAATFNAMLDRIQAAFETQRRFLADASHELRTPLTAIRGNVEVALRQSADADLPPDVVDALEDARRESERMGRLIGDLLLLARADAPDAAESARREPVRLDTLAREVTRTARGLAGGQYLEVFAPAPVAVEGDPDRLRQLLLALLDNAIRHTAASGQVVVEVAVEAPASAVLRVRDTGEGISPEDLPHVFDRFYRADSARARATGGMGLGLAIAKAIAEGHGGTIAVQSRPGEGAVFTVRLPLRRGNP
jgi:signal transduction histidine kinase